MKIRSIPKLIAIAYNYCADLYSKDEDNNVRYIYCDKEDKELNDKLLNPYNIELKYDEKYPDYEYMPFYKNKNIYNEYADIEIENVGKEVK